MKKFICKIILLAVAFAVTNVVLLFAIPKDKNESLCAYNHKVQLLKTTPQPRMIFIGGSNVAYGIDSKVISDSLHYNIVNFGQNAGIGIRFPIEDVLQYVREGDIVVLQAEYGNFFNGGNGNPETFSAFMASTDWRSLEILNVPQWKNIIAGSPRMAFANALRLIKYPVRRSFDRPDPAPLSKYENTASGYNKYGDQVSHFNYPNEKYVQRGERATGEVSKGFMDWLADAIKRYEQAGVTFVMLPPVCIHSYFLWSYNENIEKALIGINHPYFVSPSLMVVDDSCMFNMGYHVNREGCNQNTQNIIRSLHYLKNGNGDNTSLAK